MSRVDSGVAQRYAAKKRKKRLVQGRPIPAAPRPLAAASVEKAAEEPGSVATNTRPASAAPTVIPTRVSARTQVSTRRPFSDYADDYRYVYGDLRRVALVAGGLLVGLIGLSFFIH